MMKNEIYALILVLLTVVAICYAIYREYKKRSTVKNVTHAPEPLRSLSDTERKVLRDMFNTKLVLGVISMAATIFFAINENFGNARYLLPLPFIIGVFVCLRNMFVLQRDMRSEVFHVQGQLFKDWRRHLRSTYAMPYTRGRLLFKVGSLTFPFTEFEPSLMSVYQSLQDGDEIEVIYSPHTKYIWSIKNLS